MMETRHGVAVLTSPKRVLVVEDDRSVRRALEKALAAAGYLVESVASGEAALEIIGQELFDTVLLDMGLPGISGLETLRQIRVLAPSLPVILITGCDSNDLARLAERNGAAMLRKPFDLSAVLESLEMMLDR